MYSSGKLRPSGARHSGWRFAGGVGTVDHALGLAAGEQGGGEAADVGGVELAAAKDCGDVLDVDALLDLFAGS